MSGDSPKNRFKKVLIVDDEESIRRSLSRLVERSWGACPYAAADLATARTLACRHEFDVGLIDLCVPDGNGIELIREMHASNARAILLLLTGFGSTRDVVDAVQAGATDVLIKPILPKELAESVLRTRPQPLGAPTEVPTARRALWELVQRVVPFFDGNISAASRALKLSRNTVKRWYSMRRPKK